jgi:SAM-dependent methyltransferase
LVAEASTVALDRALPTLTFATGDLHSVVAAAGGYDVVHAHQVLQHVADPVAALQAMAALVAPRGLVAARDAYYSAMTWWPSEPSLDRWLQIYRGVTKHNGAECDAGRRLLHWARQAGFQTVEYSTSNWTYATPADLDWWCDLWADPVIATRFADQAVEFGLSDRDELSVISAARRAWGRRDDAVFVVPHGEIIAMRDHHVC